MKILFVCTGNSARSQMAEAFLRHYGQGRVEASSAGIDPKGLHPLTIKVMAEKGIDVSGQRSKASTDEILREADCVVTVCGHADQHCPALPAHVRKVHWPLEDPAVAQGSEAEIVAKFREIRDQIEARVQDLVRGGWTLC